ncbi:RNA-directed DNA polymerase, eukaryota [Tanacetum coccineum]
MEYHGRKYVKSILSTQDQILASKNNDGLGVGILNAFNLALLQKWRWRLVTNPNLLWVSLVKAIHGKDASIANKRPHNSDINLHSGYMAMVSKDGMFSDSDTRIHIDATTLPINSYVSLWSNLLLIKVNIFIWRLCFDHLPHRLNLSLRGLEIESLRCPSCYTGIESADHIFFTCSLAKEVWRLIFRWVEFSAQQLNSFSDCHSWLG